MITINQYPNPVTMAGQNSILDVTGSQQYLAIGSKSFFVATFNIGQTIVSGDSFTISWLTHSLKIEFVTHPNESGSQYYIPSTTITQNWLDGFYIWLSDNYLISTYFEFNGIATYQSKENGLYTMAITAISNPTAFSFFVAQGSDPVINADYKLICKVESPTFGELGDEIAYPDRQGNSAFNISAYLFSKLKRSRETNFNHIWAGASLFKAHPTHSLDFYLKFAESIDGNVGNVSRGDTHQALLGGQDFVSSNFLTTSPSPRKVSPNSPERLYFFNDADRTINLRVNRNSDTGTTINLLLESFVASANTVYEINANIFAGTSPVDSVLVKYGLYLTDQNGTPITETKSYLVDYQYYRSEEYFMWLNGMGEYDTMRCTGRLQAKTLFDRSEFISQNNQRHQYNILREYAYTINTGSISLDEVNWLNDFLLSHEPYWISNGEALPISITTTATKYIKDDQRRFNVSFNFSLSKFSEYA